MHSWTPGDIPSKWIEKKFLCSIEKVTGFVGGTATKDETSETVARIAFYHLFFLNGLPRIVIVACRTALKGAVTTL